MGRLLFLLFLIVPLIEIGIFILVGQAIGLWLTLGGVVVTALIGSAIIRVQGLSLISEIQRLMGVGTLPARQIADGVMLAISGALLLTPGYFTDAIGFALLVPGFRTLVYNYLKSRIQIVGTFQAGSRHEAGFSDPFRDTGAAEDPDIVDLDEKDWR